MKITNSKFLIINILVLTISACANQENNSNSSTTIIYDNQLTHKSIVFTEVDTIGVIMPNISKNYLFKLEGLTTDNQEVKIDDKWILYFAIIDLKGKGYFIPDRIFPSIKQEFPKNLLIEQDFSISLTKIDNEDFYFEIELCYRIEKSKIKHQSSRGITIQKDKLIYSEYIYKALLNPEVKDVEIKKRKQISKDDICRKIKIKQKGYDIFFSEIKSQNLGPNFSPIFQSQKILESGNLLDTMKIEEFIWTDYSRLYE